MAIDVSTICLDECFSLSFGIFSPMDLTHQYPWAKANMAIDVSTICWDEYFSLSFGINVANEI